MHCSRALCVLLLPRSSPQAESLRSELAALAERSEAQAGQLRALGAAREEALGAQLAAARQQAADAEVGGWDGVIE